MEAELSQVHSCDINAAYLYTSCTVFVKDNRLLVVRFRVSVTSPWRVTSPFHLSVTPNLGRCFVSIGAPHTGTIGPDLCAEVRHKTWP